MPQREDVLREKTFKGEFEDVAHRVFHTLTAQKEFEQLRTMHVLSSLIELLTDKGVLTEAELDDLLLKCTG